jgi:hypothetical protein
MRTRNNRESHAYVSFSVIIGAAFLHSGYMHMNFPFAFLSSIMGYSILNGIVAIVLAGALPAMLVILGVWNCAGVNKRLVAPMSSALLFVFAIAQWSALVRGLDIQCGCFGFENSPISWQTVALVSGLLLKSIYNSCSAFVYRDNQSEG